jgi:exodeoxyribonuclease V gamma subunit
VVEGPDPFERRRRALRVLAAEPGLVDLPQTWHIFAPPQVAPGVVETVAALAAHRSVHVWVAAPGVAVAADARWRHDYPLASLGEARRRATAGWLAVARVRDVPSTNAPPRTLLQRLQADVCGSAGSDLADLVPDSADRSVQVHSSHGPERQVEVLRDVLVDLLQRDPSLEPATWWCSPPTSPPTDPSSGLAAAWIRPRVRSSPRPASVAVPTSPARRIRARRAQQGARPCTSRAEVAGFLDLCAAPPVARRFGFGDESSIERIGVMLRGAGTRWGIDSTTRQRFGVGVLSQNTWQAGLNRLLLGVTMSERDLVSIGTAIPYDLVESQDVWLLGSLAELAGRLREAVDLFGTPASPLEWSARFRTVELGRPDPDAGVVGGLVSVPARDGWQVSQAHAQLSSLAETAGADAPRLSLGDVKVLVRDRLQGHRARSALLTGNLTVAEIDALPQVPHRVVVLLGLDEQQFPRPVVADGDDPLPRQAGEPDPSLDDRQAFLDALMAAEETFVVIHRGRDTRTNDEVPAPIPVRDLVTSAEACHRRVVTSHRLQPYDLATFAAGGPVSYDAAAAAGAAALANGRAPGAPGPRDRSDIRGLPPATPADQVSIDDLISFLRHPLKHFLRLRAGITDAWSDDPADQIPVELNGLEEWAVKERLLQARLAGHDRPTVENSERLRGELPPGALGGSALIRALDQVDQVVTRLAPIVARSAREVPVSLRLAGGILLTGLVRTHDGLVALPVIGYVKGRDWADLWVRLLAVAAAAPRDEPWEGVLVGRDGIRRLRAPADPAAHLVDILTLYLQGLDAVVLLPPDTAFALAEARAQGRGVDKKPRDRWRFESGGWRGFAPPDFDGLLDHVGPDGLARGVERLADRIYRPVVVATLR